MLSFRLTFIGGLCLFFGISSLTSVSAASEFFRHAETLSAQGVIQRQYTEGGYRLTSTLSRAEATKLALSSAGVPKGSSCSIPSEQDSLMGIDILADTYSDVSYRLGDLCGFIQTAVTAGILERDTTRVTMFRPNSPITRGDFADIIVRSYDGAVPGFITIPSEGSRYYTDVVPYTMSNSNITSNLQTSNSSSVSSSNSINRLATTGCLNTNLTTYRSYVSITRGEAFKIMGCLVAKKGSMETGTNTSNQTNTNTNTNNQTNTNTNNSNLTTSNFNLQSSNSSSPLPLYSWSTSSYGTCSKTCGEGVQTRTVSCKRISDNVTVSDSFCNLSINTRKPVTQQLCNVAVCQGGSTSGMNQGNITQGQGSVGSSQGGTSNALGGNSTITSGASTQEQDPGTGLWIPRSNPNLYVFDPIILGKKHFGVVSPCFMNGRDYSSSWDCGSLYNWIGTFYDQDNKVVHFSGVSSGSVVSFRFTTLPDTDELQIPTFTLAGGDGGNFGLIASISLSENPGEFIEGSLCYRERAHSSSTRTSFLTPHGYRLFVSKYPDSSMNYCVLEANKEYYYNMKFLKDYSHLNFQLHGDGVIGGHILEEVISSNESGIPGRSTDSLCSPTPSNVSVIGVNAQGGFPFNSPGLRIDWASSNTMAYKFVFGLENRTNGGIAYVDGNAGTGRKDISISTCPGVYDVPTECRSSGRNSGVISWSTDANQSGCKLVPGASYYLNVRPYHTGSYVGYAITNQ